MDHPSRHLPADVVLLTQPTKGFVCPPDANHDCRLEFLQIRLRNMHDGAIFFESPAPPEPSATSSSSDPAQAKPAPRQSGVFYYDLGTNFLRLGSVGVSVTFQAGPKEIQRLRLIENHFFLDRHLKTYDFTFGQVAPGSRNDWELIYEFPPLNAQQEKMIVEQPFKLCADTFVFADDELVIHNKTVFRFLE